MRMFFLYYPLNKKAFTVVELMVVTAILGIILAASYGIYTQLYQGTQLNDDVYRTVSLLRNAQQRSMDRVNNATHGVYFYVNAGGDDQVVLFQGTSYATRNASYDLVLNVKSVVNLTTTLSGNEVVFSRGTGRPDRTGTVTLTHGVYGAKTITINSFGMLEF